MTNSVHPQHYNLLLLRINEIFTILVTQFVDMTERYATNMKHKTLCTWYSPCRLYTL